MKIMIRIDGFHSAGRAENCIERIAVMARRGCFAYLRLHPAGGGPAAAANANISHDNFHKKNNSRPLLKK
ncbi:MAG TPA: hypothetical protein VFS02_16975 [Telluria sp.]|nr:hypothetical protein [Telluria sp.]